MYFRAEVEYDIAKTTPIFKKSAPQKIDPEEYPHIHDQLRNHMVTSEYVFNTFSMKCIFFNCFLFNHKNYRPDFCYSL